MTINHPCDTCAFTPGSPANLEPHNALKAEICVLAGIPFYCHHNQSDWADLKAPKVLAGKEIRARCLLVCVGWKREVRRLADAGYFKRGRLMKKGRGVVALDALDLMRAVNVDDETKAEARAEVDKIVETLREGVRGYER